MKKRILLVALVLVAIASTIGVGFASWVISRPAEALKSGNFYVETVSDESLHLVITANDKPYFSFYGEEEGAANQAGKWLSYSTIGTAEADANRRYENKMVYFQIQVQKNNLNYGQASEPQYVNVTGVYKLHLTFAEGSLDTESEVVTGVTPVANTAAVSTAGDDDLLSGPAFSTFAGQYAATGATAVDSTNNALAQTDGKAEWSFDILTDANGLATIIIEYSWGAHFNYTTGEGQTAENHTNVNPYEYYNQFAADAVRDDGSTETTNDPKYADDAQTQLTAIHTTVNPLSFGLSIKVSATDLQTN